jgi:Fe-S cluster assembly protein SufD
MTTEVLTPTPAIVEATEKTVRGIASRWENPTWIEKRRLEAWRTYEALDLPDPGDEEWRRTDVRNLPFDRLRVDEGHGDYSEPDTSYHKGPAASPFAGVLLFDDVEERVVWLDNEVEKQGVTLEQLSQVQYVRHRRVEQQAKELMYTLVRSDEWKYVALNSALWRDGALIYVPDNAEVKLPIRVARTSIADQLAIFPRSLVIVGKHAKLTLIDERHSLDGKLFVSDVTEIFVGDGARVEYYSVNRWGDNVYNFNTVRAILGRDAEFTGVAAGLGSKPTKMRFDVEMPQPGARTELLGVTFGNKDQHFDYNTLQNHVGSHTISDLQFKSALTDSASLVWYGITRINPTAGGSEANQTSRNLLLSEHAKAAPIPILEIQAHDVSKCSHGATAGPVDENELFYLESRAIPRRTAEQMLVEGFFATVTDRIPNADVRESIMDAVAEKLGGAATDRISFEEVLSA